MHKTVDKLTVDRKQRTSWGCGLVAVLLASLLGFMSPGAIQAQMTETVLHSFASAQPLNPHSGLTADSQGNFYGTSLYGGAAGDGVVFKVDPAGHETVLYGFQGEADGGEPRSGVLRDAAGNLFGTTSIGGSAMGGTAYKLDVTGKQTTLYNFAGGAGNTSALPSGLIQDVGGSLYGTTTTDGASNAGTIFRIDPAGHETVLYNFTGGADGSGGHDLVRDDSGNLYGPGGGGIAGNGVIFKLDPAGHETVLHSFTGKADGFSPGSIVRDPSGILYGVTTGGHGTVFKLNPAGEFTTISTFTGTAGGTSPIAVTLDAAGNLFGTTGNGGILGNGVVFKIDATGKESVLYKFTGGLDGGKPVAGVILSATGDIYGTTSGGGLSPQYAAQDGVLFRLDSSGRERVVCNFTIGLGGISASHPIIRDGAGNLYGVTSRGGAFGAGTVFKVDEAGRETLLHSFTATDGAIPTDVIRDEEGSFYGTTCRGGSGKAGVVFKIDTTGKLTVLHNFGGGLDGKFPYAGVFRDLEGNLYGTTTGGGPADAGVVYKIDTEGVETILYSFTGQADGSHPACRLIRDGAGNLYGTTWRGGLQQTSGIGGTGVVFKLSANGEEMVLHTFRPSQGEGYSPQTGLILGEAESLYGNTYSGGAGFGTAFTIGADGRGFKSFNFTGAADGGHPTGVFVRDEAGNFYGTAEIGGIGSGGVVYKMDAGLRETVLYSFPVGPPSQAIGSAPSAGVVRDQAGNLFGTSTYGGLSYGGVLFELKSK